jgi:hypothetical protein
MFLHLWEAAIINNNSSLEVFLIFNMNWRLNWLGVYIIAVANSVYSMALMRSESKKCPFVI